MSRVGGVGGGRRGREAAADRPFGGQSAVEELRVSYSVLHSKLSKEQQPRDAIVATSCEVMYLALSAPSSSLLRAFEAASKKRGLTASPIASFSCFSLLCNAM